MARYRVVDRSPKFIPVVLDAQIQPGSFEYALDYLVDHELDLGAVQMLLVCHCYRNDDGAIRIISARKASTREANFYP